MPTESEETRVTDAEVEAAARAHRKRVCERVYGDIYPRLAEKGIPTEGTEVARCIEPDEWEQTLARNPETIQQELDDMRSALEAAAALHPPREGAEAESEDRCPIPGCPVPLSQHVEQRRHFNEASADRYREALVVARAELARWGWGDFHWGEQPQEQSVTDALAVIDAALGEEAENG